MIKHISIKNVAVIETAEIDFEEGFNVLTGETGAGKSIIIDAINLLKGERSSRSLIRAGESKARVCGEFETDEETAEKIADILGTDAETQIVISREMNQENKNTIRINGVPVTLSMLKEIGEYLINIHGQHDNTSLLSVKSHIEFLDKFSGEALLEALSSYRETFEKLKSFQKELEEINTDEQEKMRKKDMLSYQVEELSNADLSIGEDEELEKKKMMIDNASKIMENASAAYEMLYGEDTGNCHDMLWGAIKKLEEISDFDGELTELHSALTDAGYIIDEKARELKGYLDHTSFDMSEAREIEERLELIYNLKRKYGSTIGEILDFYEKAEEELRKIETSDERAKELEEEIKALEKERTKKAKIISDIRKSNAKELQERVTKHLADLNMAGVLFEAQIKEAPCRENGADDVEFVVCTNVGEEKKPLAKIASGGELSRIMLAIKNVLAGFDKDKTVIFDEIDAGVSGSAARKIGEKLYQMSISSQVLCITHLPQISSLADTHYLIKKQVSDERTKTIVEPLSKEGRMEEIARTLVGTELTKVALENARQLLEEAEVVKKVIKKGI